ncbi:magnesium transporter [Streptococcus pneumoniae]|nr:magnesium transporter [Streptococcus pneumoniae]
MLKNNNDYIENHQEFDKLSTKEVNDIIANYDTYQLRDLLRKLSKDSLVDLLKKVNASQLPKVLTLFSKSDQNRLKYILTAPKDSIGRILSLDYLTITTETKRAEVLTMIQDSLLSPEKHEEIWVLDSEENLIGYVTLSEVVCCNTEDLSGILHKSPLSFTYDDDQEVIVEGFYSHQVDVLPVVYEQSKLLGIITSKTAMQVMSIEHEEDFYHLQGMSPSDTLYLDNSSLKIAQNRIVWLLVLLITATFTGSIIQHYEKLLSQSVVLAAFIPMLMDSGGNAGGQSSATIIQSLAKNQISFSDLFAIIKKELTISAITGGILFIVNLLRLIIFDDISLKINIIVSLSLFLTIMISSVVGSLLPLFAKWIKQDPTVMSGPLVTTLVDVSALILYFQMASVLL